MNFKLFFGDTRDLVEQLPVEKPLILFFSQMVPKCPILRRGDGEDERKRGREAETGEEKKRRREEEKKKKREEEKERSGGGEEERRRGEGEEKRRG